MSFLNSTVISWFIYPGVNRLHDFGIKYLYDYDTIWGMWFIYRKFTIISPGRQNKTTTQTPIFRKSLPMNIYIEIISYFYKWNQIFTCASITLSINLSNVHLRLEDFPKNYLKVAVLFYPSRLTVANLRY